MWHVFIEVWFCGTFVGKLNIMVLILFLAGIFLLKVNGCLLGSDPYTSRHVCNVMKRLAVGGLTIIHPCNYVLLVPATEHGYFVASWWGTPLRHPPKVIRFYFQQTSGIHAPLGKRKCPSLSSRSPAPIADSFHVATVARKHIVLNIRELSRSNTHIAIASVLTYYGWVSLIF
jgi:hypothetical protein